MTAPAILSDGHYCPGCGYDHRGLSSDRCPECGLPIDKTRSGIIPWELRKTLGYTRSFHRTLFIATVRPTQLARSTGWPIDVRSARLFRWIVRVRVIVPCIALVCFAVVRKGGPMALQLVDGPGQATSQSCWELRFLWTVGATLWPTLPIGFVLAIILMTGISHWFHMGHLEPVRQNRAMAFSFYLCAPLGWIFIPCIAGAGIAFIATLPNADTLRTNNLFAIACNCVAAISSALIVIAMINSVRAVSAATQCGMGRSLLVGAGVIIQAAVSIAIGLALFPAIIGLLRLMIDSLTR